MLPQAEALIQQAVSETRSGKKADARRDLARAVRLEPGNARAWYLLSQLVTDPEQAIYCLERVLELLPENPRAVERLEQLKAAQQRLTAPLPCPPAEAPPMRPAEMPGETSYPLRARGFDGQLELTPTHLVMKPAGAFKQILRRSISTPIHEIASLVFQGAESSNSGFLQVNLAEEEEGALHKKPHAGGKFRVKFDRARQKEFMAIKNGIKELMRSGSAPPETSVADSRVELPAVSTEDLGSPAEPAPEVPIAGEILPTVPSQPLATIAKPRLPPEPELLKMEEAPPAAVKGELLTTAGLPGELAPVALPQTTPIQIEPAQAEIAEAAPSQVEAVTIRVTNGRAYKPATAPEKSAEDQRRRRRLFLLGIGLLLAAGALALIGCLMVAAMIYGYSIW